MSASASAFGRCSSPLLTILIQTSPIPSHPSTALLEALFRSFAKVYKIRQLSKIYILCDGYDELTKEEELHGKDGTKRGRVTSDAAARYRQHLKVLRSKLDQPPFAAPCPAFPVEMIELPERHGSAPAIKAAFRRGLVKTPFVMVAQHDNFFVSEVGLAPVLNTMMENEWIKCLHFLSTATIDYVNKVKRRYDMDLEPLIQHNVGDLQSPLVPLSFWFGRTAISRTDYYTDFILDRPLRVGDHLEELLGVTQLRDMQKRGPEVAHQSWGNFVLDQECEVLYHLSGRRARAVDDSSRSPHLSHDSDRGTNVPVYEKGKGDLSAKAPTDASSGSFTTARTARAIVPGLELIPNLSSADGKYGSTNEVPKGKFKQRCFHCGEKGHSFKFCPDRSDLPDAETIDLTF